METRNELEFTASILTPRSANATTSVSLNPTDMLMFFLFVPCDCFYWSDLHSWNSAFNSHLDRLVLLSFMMLLLCVEVFVRLFRRPLFCLLFQADRLMWFSYVFGLNHVSKCFFGFSRSQIQQQEFRLNTEFIPERSKSRVTATVAQQFSWNSKMDARKELDIQRESGFIFTDESKLRQREEEDLGKGDMIQRRWVRWVFSHDGSCGVTPTAASVCLQLWINRLEARELVLVEGDTHSCGAANIGAGSCRGESAGGNQASHPLGLSLWCLTGASHRSWQILCLPSEGNPNHHRSSFRRKSEVRSSSPEAGEELRSRLWSLRGRLPPKMFPLPKNWFKLQRQLKEQFSLSISCISSSPHWALCGARKSFLSNAVNRLWRSLNKGSK